MHFSVSAVRTCWHYLQFKVTTDSCNSYFLFLPHPPHPIPLFPSPLTTTPHTSFPQPSSPPSGICTCCSPATTCCPWRTGFSTRRLIHFQSSTWATSPCLAVTLLSDKQAAPFCPPHHKRVHSFAYLPPTHPKNKQNNKTKKTPTNTRQTYIQTLNWFLTENTNQRGWRDHTEQRGLVSFSLYTSMFYSLTLSICVFSA